MTGLRVEEKPVGATILDEQLEEKQKVVEGQQETETLHNRPGSSEGFQFGLCFRKACLVLILLSHSSISLIYASFFGWWWG